MCRDKMEEGGAREGGGEKIEGLIDNVKMNEWTGI